MKGYVPLGGLLVRHELATAVAETIAPAAGVKAEKFWDAVGSIITDMAPRNAAFMRTRDAMQAQIDAWILERRSQVWDAAAYKSFLRSIGYIVPEGSPFRVSTWGVDEAIQVAAPQLVVPVDNARYAINAVNARWGSLLDAFYGTTAGPPETNGCEKGTKYNPQRGKKVFELAHAFLDDTVGLASGVYENVAAYSVNGNKLELTLSNGKKTVLAQPTAFVGYQTSSSSKLSSVLLKHNGLHIEIVIDANKGPGKSHPAGVCDIRLESATTVIMDCEDSVAAVDGADKAIVYSNWARLNQGSLTCNVRSKGKAFTRQMLEDKIFISPSGGQLTLPGRALMLVRNVGMHCYTDACLTAAGQPVPEAMLDCAVTALGAMPDLLGASSRRNSRHGSMYIVRPKMHGPAEVAFAVELFERVEQALSLPAKTLKLGIMDEERRTTVNLPQCIGAASDRVIFINTGFLDRTGDEIHTSFEAGPVLPKAGIKTAAWRVAYEDWNVDVGIACGLVGRAQIGKGMWAKPDELGEMLDTKGEHPKAGATTAWVPSPTAGTLHAIHYHQTDVQQVQQALAKAGRRAKLDDILTPPLLNGQTLSEAQVKRELENNAQGILGYVVRWVQQGVGCSKVPDINDVGLMEDRATLRIASQAIANWLHHGVCSREQVMQVMQKMARLVDRQNAKDALYRPMAPSFSNNAWLAAVELVFNGKDCPNGYTEFALFKWRRKEKAQLQTGSQATSKL